MEDAVISLIAINRFYATVLSKCVKEKTELVPTAAVAFNRHGKLLLMYNEKWLLSKPLKEIQAVLIHEVLHIFFRHLIRFKDEFSSKKTATMINWACDIAINQFIDNKWKDPAPLMPDTFGFPPNLAADEYYELLKEKMKKEEGEGKGEGNETMDDHSMWGKIVVQEIDKDGNVKSEKVIDIKDLPDLDPEQELTQAVKKAIDECKDYGDVPDFIKKEIDRLKEGKPRHNWKRELKVFVNSVLTTHRKMTIKRLNRRFYPLGFYLPGKKKTKKPRVLLARDTSGSCYCEVLQQEFLNEMVEISKHVDMTVIDFDTKIKQEYKVKRVQDFKGIIGNGGTNFSEIFERAKKSAFDAIVIMTDTYGPAPKKDEVGKFARHTVWVTFESQVEIPFGKLVYVKEND